MCLCYMCVCYIIIQHVYVYMCCCGLNTAVAGENAVMAGVCETRAGGCEMRLLCTWGRGRGSPQDLGDPLQ